MMTSAPALTRSRSEAKSLAASASEMWITSLAIKRLYTVHAPLCFGRAFAFFLGLCPSCACCFAGKLFPLLWRESCHARLYALAFCCLPALSAHLTHDSGNQVASHSFIL